MDTRRRVLKNMTEKNPLDVSPIVQIQTPSFVSYNKRGRPKLENLITFSPEPKSIIITQIINQKKKEAHQENVTDLERTEDSEEAQWISNSGTPPEPIIFSHIINQKKTEAHQENIITDVKKAEDSEEAQLISNSETQIRPHHPLYYCDYADCSYTCKLTCNLIKHKRTHTEEKPYLCDQCSFRSNFINSLKVHKRIHTSERPYSCKHCNYRCNSSSNLKKHSLHRHPEVPKT